MINLLIGLAVVVFIVSRQLIARPARETSATRLVLILGVIGIVEIIDASKHHTLSAETIGLIVVSLTAAGALGAARALTVRVWRDDVGAAWQKGRWTTAALWVVAIGIHLALDVAIDGSTSIHSLGTTTLLLYLAVSLGTQREIIRYRVAGLGAGAGR